METLPNNGRRRERRTGKIEENAGVAARWRAGEDVERGDEGAGKSEGEKGRGR